MDSDPSHAPDTRRRALIAKAAYVVPVILSLQAAPQHAKAGSEKSEGSGSPQGPPNWKPGPPPWPPGPPRRS